MNKSGDSRGLCSVKILLLSLLSLSFVASVAPTGAEADVEGVGPAELLTEVALLVREGETLAKQGRLLSAVSAFTRALGLLEGFPPEHPMRLRVERELKIAKGRVIVARHKGLNPNALFPVVPAPPLKEPAEVKAEEVFGTVSLGEGKWKERYLKNPGDGFAFGRRVVVASGAGVELTPRSSFGIGLRAVETASFSFLSGESLRVHSGAYALRAIEDDAKFKVEGPFASFEITSDDRFAVMFGVTTNGGMKVIGLVGDPQLLRPGEKTVSLRPGQLVFVLPDGYSRKMYVELSTLITTARLLTAFDEPPTYYKRLKTEALAQALRTKRRFRTIVGDVKGSGSFEVKVLREEEISDK